jgi:hypothetical protein
MTERTSQEVETLTIRIPIQLRRRGGRKLIVTPEGTVRATPKPRRDDTLIKALVRAHRWRRQIESGRARSITDLAEQEGVTDAYVCRLLPLTCLAPDIMEAILDGRQPKGLRLAEVLGSGPYVWSAQRETWGFINSHRPSQTQPPCSALSMQAAVGAGAVGRQVLPTTGSQRARARCRKRRSLRRAVWLTRVCGRAVRFAMRAATIVRRIASRRGRRLRQCAQLPRGEAVEAPALPS